mmetsp:Transcript_6573/g.11107  ORF Transcript_6573/g.11107 Transcript_6573/m.11107 type:complete len:97 (-) Transcript_6573:57-347(-)
MCKVGEVHDSEFYCVENIFIQSGQVEYLEEAATQSYKLLIFMFSLMLTLFLSLTLVAENEGELLKYHPSFFDQFEKKGQKEKESIELHPPQKEDLL